MFVLLIMMCCRRTITFSMRLMMMGSTPDDVELEYINNDDDICDQDTKLQQKRKKTSHVCGILKNFLKA
ncbi:hypothetical protein Syun_012010 [Stephania yunnanensis]|uniref:Secreted protein n=1 Tax=Stephania yunnanensis TaxID=152371 RepID=A0AAP0JZM5_9MAGN